MILKMYFRETRLEGVDWLDLAQDMDRLQVLVSTSMKFWVSQKPRIS
jgi:hypothetical protein